MGLTIDHDRKLVRRAERRRLLNLAHVASAEKTLGTLPEPGETYHIITGGSWPGFALIGATLRLAPGCTIPRLWISTLSYSKESTSRLAAWLDDGTVWQLGMLYSIYFRATSNEDAAALHDMMAARKQRVAALRLHSKVIAIELSDGRAFTFEGSKNLRSANNVENLTATHDRALFEFHRQWMDELLTRAEIENPSLCSAKV